MRERILFSTGWAFVITVLTCIGSVILCQEYYPPAPYAKLSTCEARFISAILSGGGNGDVGLQNATFTVRYELQCELYVNATTALLNGTYFQTMSALDAMETVDRISAVNRSARPPAMLVYYNEYDLDDGISTDAVYFRRVLECTLPRSSFIQRNTVCSLFISFAVVFFSDRLRGIVLWLRMQRLGGVIRTLLPQWNESRDKKET